MWRYSYKKGGVKMVKIFWGIVIIGIGLWIWLSNLGIASFRWSRDWPVIIILIGLGTLLSGIWWIKRRKG